MLMTDIIDFQMMLLNYVGRYNWIVTGGCKLAIELDDIV